MKVLISLLMFAACSDGSDHTAIDARALDASGDAPGPSTVVHGMLGRSAFDARDAIFKNTTANGFDFPGPSTVIEIKNFANTCALETNSTGMPNGHVLILVLGKTDSSGGSSPATETGTYPVFSGTPAASAKLAEAYWEIDGADCLKSSQASAMSGSVSVTSAADPQRGTVDLVFPDNEHVTGSYSAPSCAGLDPNRTALGGC